MKKIEKIFISMTSLSVLLNNVSYASTEVTAESSTGLPIKYIFMGIAALVLILLLYLGYKMDTKDSEAPSKVSNKAQKTKKKLTEKVENIKENEGTYEADESAYEADNVVFNNEDLNDSTEYKEDEGSLYSMNNDTLKEEDSDDNIPNFDTSKNPVKSEESDDGDGEVFDTSIIDKLDDDTEIKDKNESDKNSFDKTMQFDSTKLSPSEKKIEDEIDNLDNLDNVDTTNVDNSELNNNLITNTPDDSDDFIKKLKSYEEPETTFEGFSVAPKEKKVEEEPENNNIDENTLNNDDVDENVNFENNVSTNNSKTSSSIDDDFLSQMEENLKKNQESRQSKKAESTSKSTTESIAKRRYTKKK